MMRKILLPTIAALALLLNACNGCSNTQQITDKIEPSLDFESISVIDSIDAIFYALPSPEEILNYINDNKVVFNPKLMHNYKEAKLYEGYEKKAIACGIYFADLAYISAFNKSDFSSEYLSTVDYLLKELNINPSFSKEQQKRIVDASVMPDSIYAVSRELYDTVISYLQEYDQGKALSLLSAGAFVESLYITTSLHNNFDKQKEAIDRIAEQKLLFEDIFTMVKTYQSDASLTAFINDLNILEKSYKDLNVNFGGGESNMQTNGTLHIESKNDISISEESYFIFSDNVKEFRTRIIRQ